MDTYLYLIINLSAILIPFIFSFHKKLNFHYHFKSFFIGFLFVFYNGVFLLNEQGYKIGGQNSWLLKSGKKKKKK